jgi:hypothetical protein
LTAKCEDNLSGVDEIGVSEELANDSALVRNRLIPELSLERLALFEQGLLGIEERMLVKHYEAGFRYKPSLLIVIESTWMILHLWLIGVGLVPAVSMHLWPRLLFFTLFLLVLLLTPCALLRLSVLPY